MASFPHHCTSNLIPRPFCLQFCCLQCDKESQCSRNVYRDITYTLMSQTEHHHGVYVWALANLILSTIPVGPELRHVGYATRISTAGLFFLCSDIVTLNEVQKNNFDLGHVVSIYCFFSPKVPHAMCYVHVIIMFHWCTIIAHTIVLLVQRKLQTVSFIVVR